jgi:hypothetical protein
MNRLLGPILLRGWRLAVGDWRLVAGGPPSGAETGRGFQQILQLADDMVAAFSATSDVVRAQIAKLHNHASDA